MEEVDEREIFEGLENTLTMEQTYTHQFQCSFELEQYPFDRQTCSIDMTTTKLDRHTMMIRPDKLWMEQSKDMILFHMDSWKLDYKNKDVQSFP